MTTVIGAFDAYVPRSATEALDVERVRGITADADPFARSNPLHITGSALVVHVDSRKVLLRWHEWARRWIQVGGHGDLGEEDPRQVAKREAVEETGLADLRPFETVGSSPVQIAIVPVGAHGDEPDHEHADFRYVFATERPELAVAESPASPVRWVPIDTAIAEASEENLRELFVRVRDLLDQLRQATRS